ncbi:MULTISPECIES: NADH-quinone oxidoreductase subunit NuoK [Pelosinus]|jgi:NADH-quinone oxidoreductase subunit K|uniref:NADH-quinone oxidoreductase subunit K n=1 Tax=Pelosinus fermentans B4 TaxID=1149862 RepID=I9L838_9FIRM|nr:MULTISPECIES: NADH-quinone oxidoreductase subunit NuoK [Pelosinus]MDF2570417.1 NAD(P)H-quinone oxidoreductase subunit [Sporomusa sp.]EIW16421.1 NADH-ubiquinone oxidoreductase chain 4L [Pelosinus fermentans B4]EIW22598.1 NAD(P)H-quinone oxidoreductase subunit 4L [Pelosinus fermentans A11]OAM95728.1 NAD(P)H-quinone oxidoreductase subunit 4L [Pelosinus fermentans DSM 17108]SDR32104.1 NADH dehydrogenase subunit K [Pelosinus fermentans]
MIGLVHYLTVGALLFTIGLYGVLTKRNIVAMLMSIELMLNAVNINLVAFSHFITPELLTGQVFALFTISVAASEVAVGLALVFRVYHDRNTVYADRLNWLRW